MHEIREKCPILSPEVPKLTATRTLFLFWVQLNELCIHILHEAQKAEWLPAFTAPWSSTKKQNQVVVSAAGVQIKNARMCAGCTPCLYSIWQSVCGPPLPDKQQLQGSNDTCRKLHCSQQRAQTSEVCSWTPMSVHVCTKKHRWSMLGVPVTQQIKCSLVLLFIRLSLFPLLFFYPQSLFSLPPSFMSPDFTPVNHRRLFLLLSASTPLLSPCFILLCAGGAWSSVVPPVTFTCLTAPSRLHPHFSFISQSVCLSVHDCVLTSPPVSLPFQLVCVSKFIVKIVFSLFLDTHLQPWPHW